MLSRAFLERTLSAGVLLAIVAGGIVLWELRRGQSLADAQVATLTGVVVYKAFHVLSRRSETRSVLRTNPLPNPVLLVGGTAALVIPIGGLYFVPTHLLWNFRPLSPETWPVILLVGTVVPVLVESNERLRNRDALLRSDG